jgi:O-antigen/teichoic acid export membrane protein
MDRGRAGAIVSLRLLLATFLWVLTGAASALFIEQASTRMVILLFSATAFPVALTLDWPFQGKEQFGDAAGARLAQYVIYGALVFFLVQGPEDVALSAVAFGGGSFVSVLILWIRYRQRWGALRLNFSPPLWRSILTAGVPVGVAMFLAQSVSNFPPLVLGYLASKSDVGIFSAAMKVIFVALLLDRVFNALFLPVVTRHFARDVHDESHRLLQTTLRILLAVVLPCAISGGILGREAIRLLYGEGYEAAAPVLAVLMAYFLFTLLNSFFTAVLIGAGREADYTKMTCWGAVVLLIAVVAGTALSGVMGAAAGVVAGEFVTVVLMGFAAKGSFGFPLANNLWRPVVAAACMLTCAIICRDLNPYLATVVSCAIFLASLVIVRGITTEEVQFLRERFV